MANANSQFGGYLTNVGVAKQTNANALGIPWKITSMLLGDAGGEPALFPDPTPQPTQTALIRKVYEAQINSLYPSPDDPGILIAELVLPPNVGGWWIRESALKDEDGDLIAVAAPAPSYKPLLAQGSGRTQTIRMHVVVGNTANITLKIDPSIVLATRAQVETGDAAAREYAASLALAHVESVEPHRQYRLRGAITSLTANTALTAAHEGMVLIDATAGDRTIILPASTPALGVRDIIVRRTDNTGNSLVVQASGTDKIKHNTHLRAAGYSFLLLMGAGDFWHLRSDGAGDWWPIARLDSTPCGRVTTETSIVIPPGGYGPAWGVEYLRSQLPWLYDYASQSWTWYLEEAWHLDKWGGWSSGDGVTTFRGPEVRGEFGRFLDEGRGVDVGREAGSFKADSVAPHHHPLRYWNYKDGTGTGSHGYVKTWTDPYTSTGTRDEGTGPNTGTETRPRSTPFPGRIKLI